MRKDIQHLKLEVKIQKTEISGKHDFTTAEGIEKNQRILKKMFQI